MFLSSLTGGGTSHNLEALNRTNGHTNRTISVCPQRHLWCYTSEVMEELINAAFTSAIRKGNSDAVNKCDTFFETY